MIDLMLGGYGKMTEAIWTTVSGWIITLHARGRMRKSLGKTPTDLELASLKTWMKVEETEQREEESRPIHPR